MKITKKQINHLIREYTDFSPRDFRQQDSIIFLEYLADYVKSGRLNNQAEIDLVYPENAPVGKYSIRLTQNELIERIPALINQINLSLGGEDALPTIDNSGAFGSNQLKSYQRDDVFKQLTIYVPVVLEEKVTFPQSLVGIEKSNHAFGLILFIMFDGSSSQIYFSEEALGMPDILIIDTELVENNFDFAFELLSATNDASTMQEFIQDSAAQSILPIEIF
tara:strand:- start:787 stop:1449 length:663 start_codon:yes stop_codon:yes gene_type:complete